MKAPTRRPAKATREGRARALMLKRYDALDPEARRLVRGWVRAFRKWASGSSTAS